MRRTTKKQIHAIETQINNLLDEMGADYEIFVQWAYGQPRAHKIEADGTYDLSPRLATGPMYDWLYAFYQGLAHAHHLLTSHSAHADNARYFDIRS